jgi:hypothetical protein
VAKEWLRPTIGEAPQGTAETQLEPEIEIEDFGFDGDGEASFPVDEEDSPF